MSSPPLPPPPLLSKSSSSLPDTVAITPQQHSTATATSAFSPTVTTSSIPTTNTSAKRIADQVKSKLLSLLQPSESCVAVIEVTYVNQLKERRPRYIALISHRPGDEACLFVCRQKGKGEDGTVSLLVVLPVLADFQYTFGPGILSSSVSNAPSEQVLKLSCSEMELRFGVPTPEQTHMQPFLNILQQYVLKAQLHKYTKSTSHMWLLFYDSSMMLSSPISNIPPGLIPPSNANVNNYNNNNMSTAQRLDNPFIHFESAVHPQNLVPIKQTWVAKQLRKRVDSFSKYEPLKLFIGSWNVNGKFTSESLKPWLHVTDKSEEPDIMVIAFQELDLRREAYLVTDSSREEMWTQAIMDGIGDHARRDYIKLASKQLIGMLIMVYVKRRLEPHISEISTDSVGTGIMGMMGNKGGVSVRMRVYDTYLCFVNTHLAADTSQVDRRNQDFSDICRKLTFGIPNHLYDDYVSYTLQNPWVPGWWDSSGGVFGGSGGTAPFSGGELLAGKMGASIFDCDHLFWMGDLNYRVPLPDYQVKESLRRGLFEEMLRCDQLNIEKQARRAFSEFQEAPITFLPTYKYDVGTSHFDTSEKRRSPSWCDRILWFRNPLRTQDPDWVRNQYYKSCMELVSSDHKPIKTLFTIQSRHINKDALRNTQATILRDLDKFENESLPIVSLSSTNLNFTTGPDEYIKFLIPMTKTLLLENKGQVIAQWRFAPKSSDGAAICPKWMWIEPRGGMLVPGEKINIHFTIYVDKHVISKLMNSEMALEDILILHLENGKDHFITVSGELMSSCFGVDLAVLCNVVSCMRDKTIKEVVEMAKMYNTQQQNQQPLITTASSTTTTTTTTTTTHKLSIPKELWRMIDFIWRYGMQVDGLFLTNGDAMVCAYLRDCLDTGTDFDLEFLLNDHAQEDMFAAASQKHQIQQQHQNLQQQQQQLLHPNNPFYTGGSHSRLSSSASSLKSVDATSLALYNNNNNKQIMNNIGIPDEDIFTPLSRPMSLIDIGNLSLSSEHIPSTQPNILNTSSGSLSGSVQAHPELLLAASSPISAMVPATTTAIVTTSSTPNLAGVANSTRTSTASLAFSVSSDTLQRRQSEQKYHITKPPLSRGGTSTAIHSMAETLIQWLDSLPEPLIPYAYYNACLTEGLISFTHATKIIQNMGMIHYTVFIYLISFLKEVIGAHHAARTGELTAARIAQVFAPVILRPPPTEILNSNSNSIVTSSPYKDKESVIVTGSPSKSSPTKPRPMTPGKESDEVVLKKKVAFLMGFLNTNEVF